MKFTNRLKAAVKSFINPSLIKQKTMIQVKEFEPEVVLENKLLAGKNVLITGAGQNIGRSIAIEMAKQGANIYFTDIEAQKIENLEQELNSFSVKSRGFISYVNKQENTDFLMEYFAENKINIDILVNNVGIQFNQVGIQKINSEELQKIFENNVFGPIYLTKKIAEIMINNQIQGSIIFITSIHQFTLFRDYSYSASKAALAMIIEELAIDLSAKGIRVNGIAPGWVKEDEEKKPLYDQYTPLSNSSINPCYIGRAAVYLASNYFSRFTTGTIIKIDGGLSLYNYQVAQHPPQ